MHLSVIECVSNLAESRAIERATLIVGDTVLVPFKWHVVNVICSTSTFRLTNLLNRGMSATNYTCCTIYFYYWYDRLVVRYLTRNELLDANELL